MQCLVPKTVPIMFMLSIFAGVFFVFFCLNSKVLSHIKSTSLSHLLLFCVEQLEDLMLFWSCWALTKRPWCQQCKYAKATRCTYKNIKTFELLINIFIFYFYIQWGYYFIAENKLLNQVWDNRHETVKWNSLKEQVSESHFDSQWNGSSIQISNFISSYKIAFFLGIM